MGVVELLRWQWKGYSRAHQSRANLVLHIFFVPIFLLGNVGFIVALARASWLSALFALAAMIVSIALQGRGHSGEAIPPEPFSNPTNAVTRIFLEQWVTFPRFVFSGGWSKAMRGAAA